MSRRQSSYESVGIQVIQSSSIAAVIRRYDQHNQFQAASVIHVDTPRQVGQAVQNCVAALQFTNNDALKVDLLAAGFAVVCRRAIAIFW